MPPDAQPQAPSTAGPPSWMAPVTPVIPDHELVRRIGGGSYGDVWLARTAVGTWRAVKVVFRDRFTDARPYEREFSGMLKFEPLSRGNEAFVDILQIGRNDADGYFYYVMELADDAAPAAGSDQCSVISNQSSERDTQRSLATENCSLNTDLASASYIPKTLSKVLLQRGRLPVGECLELGLTLNLGLAHLHRAGLIHRDIKPSNLIFVGGVPKLADIGLVIEVTEARSFVGTEGFIPPEGPNSPQADLYSLGKVLYEAGMGKDRKDFPEPLTQLGEVPDSAQLLEFNAILLRACAANRAERYQSAEEMNADLALLQSGGSVRRQRKLAGQLRRVRRVGAGLTLVALVATGLYLWQAGQARRMAALAAEARRNELVARENLYAADIHLAHQALLADNVRQARVLLQNQVPKPGEPDLRGFEWRHLWQQARGEESFSLPGHPDGAWRVEFSPDGKQLATGGADGTVKLWDLASRQEVAHLATDEGILSVSFSPKGDLLATASDEQVWLWDAQTSAKLRRLPGARLQAKFSPDGTRLLTLATNGLILWDTADWSMANSSEEPKPRSSLSVQAAFAPDGKRLVVTMNDQIRFLSLPELRELGGSSRSLATGPSSLPFVALSPDNRTVAAHGTGFGVMLWDFAGQRETHLLVGHTDHVMAAKFSPDGSRLATGSADQTIRLWEVATGRLIRVFRGQADEVFDLAFSPDGQRLASVGFNSGGVKLWESGAPPRPDFIHEPLDPVGFTPTGQLMAFGKDANLVLIDPATLRTEKLTEPKWAKGPSQLSFLGNLSPDGRTLGLWVPGEQLMEVWDTHQQRHLGSVASTRRWARHAPRRNLLVTDTRDQTTTVWQLPSGTPKWVFTNSQSSFQVVTISPDENLVLTDEVTRSRLWRIEGDGLSPLATFNPKRAPVSGVSFSPDGRWLATGQEGALIKLWALPSTQEVAVLSGHTRNVIALAFSPDSRTLASMCDDRTVRLWHVATRRELLRFQSPKEDQGFFSLAFSPDGCALAVRRTDADGPITWVWAAPSWPELAAADAKP
jgi:WD40 repeat protein